MSKEYHYVVVARRNDDGSPRFYLDCDTTFGHFMDGIVYDDDAGEWYWPNDEDTVWDEIGEILEKVISE